MAAIQNTRTLRLQATVPRIIPVPVPIDQVEGLPEALENAAAGAKRLTLTSTAVHFFDTTPASATLTAAREGGLTGTITWSVVLGTATLTGTGDGVRTVAASSIPLGGRAVIQATCGSYIAQIVLSRSSILAAQTQISLASQVTGMLANGNVSGLGALALLNQVNLNTQVFGALNGATQVTNLGVLAYADGIAANQIGAGTLAAGVAYIGVINAAQITAGELRGRLISTKPSGASGSEIQLRPYGVSDEHTLLFYDGTGTESHRITAGVAVFRTNVAGETPLFVQKTTVGGNAASIGASTAVVALNLGTLNTGAPLRLAPQNALPKTANITQGAMAMHNVHALCIYDGTNWYKVLVDPTPVA